jgi:hypothetical protein
MKPYLFLFLRDSLFLDVINYLQVFVRVFWVLKAGLARKNCQPRFFSPVTFTLSNLFLIENEPVIPVIDVRRRLRQQFSL